MRGPSLWAYFWLVVAEFAVGVSVVSGKYVVDHMHPYMFIGGRFLISTIILGSAMLLFKQKVVSPDHPLGKLTNQEWGWMILQGLTGGMLFNVLFYFGVGYTSATSAGIIGSTLPAIVAVCAYFMLKEALTLRKMVALLLAVVGILIIGFDNAEGSDEAVGSYFGDLLVFIAMFPEALYTIFGRLLGNRVTALGSATFVSMFTLTALLPFFFFGIHKTEVNAITNIAWIALLCGGLSGVLFFWSWSKGMVGGVSASMAALFGGLMPVFTALIAYIFLDEAFTLYNAAGMLFVFASIGVGAGLSIYSWRTKPIESNS